MTLAGYEKSDFNYISTFCNGCLLNSDHPKSASKRTDKK